MCVCVCACVCVCVCVCVCACVHVNVGVCMQPYVHKNIFLNTTHAIDISNRHGLSNRIEHCM